VRIEVMEKGGDEKRKNKLIERKEKTKKKRSRETVKNRKLAYRKV